MHKLIRVKVTTATKFAPKYLNSVYVVIFQVDDPKYIVNARCLPLAVRIEN
jgi:hypothetical protein